MTGRRVGVVALPIPILVPLPAASRPHPVPEHQIPTEHGPNSAAKGPMISAFRRDNHFEQGWSAFHVSREE